MMGVAGNSIVRWVSSLLRPSPQPLPVRVSIMRIFGMPSRSGVLWFIVCGIAMLWSLNTSNSAGIMFAAIVGMAGFYAFLMPVVQLAGLRVVSVSCPSIVEGQTGQARIGFVSRRNPRALVVEQGSYFAPLVFRGHHAAASLGLGRLSRGVHPMPRIRVSSRWPFGMSAAWISLWPQGEIVVWPRPEPFGPECPGGAGQHLHGSATQQPSTAQDDWSHLREYQPGDRIRDIDWKRMAKTREIWVRQYDTRAGGDVEIRWEDTHGLEHEHRISRLARWVEEASRAGRRSSLVLPGQTIGPGVGPLHLAECMDVLARIPRHE